jgi:hypothetical protein
VRSRDDLSKWPILKETLPPGSGRREGKRGEAGQTHAQICYVRRIVSAGLLRAFCLP